MPGIRFLRLLIVCERFAISLYMIVALIHSDRNKIHVAWQNGEIHCLFFTFGSAAHAPIIIKKWSQAASLYLSPTNAFNFCILKNTYPRVSTLCIDSRKDVDTRRAHVRYYVANPTDLQNGNATPKNYSLHKKKGEEKGKLLNKIFNLHMEYAYVYKNILY